MEDDFRRYQSMKKTSARFLRKETIVATMESLPDNEYQNVTFIIRKRIFSSLHLESNVKILAKKSMNFLYH
jgi:hypothetical protein